MWWRTTICLGVCGGLGVFIALSHASRQTPVFEARARLAVPYESIQNVDRAELPIDAASEHGAARLSGSALAAWSDRAKARQLAAPTPSAFESDLDALRRPLDIIVEKQAGGDEFELIYHAADPELARQLLDAAVECCLDEYRALRKGAASTAAASVAVQLEQFRQRVTALEASRAEALARLGQMPLNETSRPGAVEKVRLLAAAIAETRQRRLESENRLAQVRSDLAEGIPADMIVSRLPEGSLRTALETSLQKRDQERELARLRSLLRERSKVWGVEHPKLKELQRQIADLDTRVRDRVVLVSTAAPAATLPLPDLLLKLLAGELQERQNNERDLGEQLTAEEGTLAEFDQRVAAIAEIDRSLAAAKSEEASARQVFETREKDQAAIGATLSSAATAGEEPISRSATEWLTMGLGGGAGVGLVLSSLLGAIWSRPARSTARTLAKSPDGTTRRSTGAASPPLPSTSRPTFAADQSHGQTSAAPQRAGFGRRFGPHAEMTASESSPLITPLPIPAALPALKDNPAAPAPPVALSDSAARLARLQQLQVGSDWHPTQMPPG